jgi:hypothetical protein
MLYLRPYDSIYNNTRAAPEEIIHLHRISNEKIVHLNQEVVNRDQKIQDREEQLAWFKRQVFGKRTEKVSAWIFITVL